MVFVLGERGGVDVPVGVLWVPFKLTIRLLCVTLAG